jgi:hypothetical protein
MLKPRISSAVSLLGGFVNSSVLELRHRLKNRSTQAKGMGDLPLAACKQAVLLYTDA